MSKVQTNVKTYNSNAEVFFYIDEEPIKCVPVSFDNVDTEETCHENMNHIKSKVFEHVEGLDVDMDTFDFEMGKIAVKVSILCA